MCLFAFDLSDDGPGAEPWLRTDGVMTKSHI